LYDALAPVSERRTYNLHCCDVVEHHARLQLIRHRAQHAMPAHTAGAFFVVASSVAHADSTTTLHRPPRRAIYPARFDESPRSFWDLSLVAIANEQNNERNGTLHAAYPRGDGYFPSYLVTNKFQWKRSILDCEVHCIRFIRLAFKLSLFLFRLAQGIQNKAAFCRFLSIVYMCVHVVLMLSAYLMNKDVYIYRGVAKSKPPTLSISSPNIGRFSKFFHRHYNHMQKLIFWKKLNRFSYLS